MTTKTINWKVAKEDARTIRNIAQRAAAMAIEYGVDYSVIDADMDITATHLNGNPLKLSELASADNLNFSHDIFGIRRHLNRQTGELEDCFVPRFSKPE